MRKFTPPPIEIGRCTDVGMRRSENQDSEDYALLEKLPYDGAHLLVVADGMGGASGGQVASSLAVEAVMDYFTKGNPNMEPDVAIREAIERGAEVVAERTSEEPALEGMGTTCVTVLVQNGYLFAGHIGDSRLYLLREGELHRLSRDHSAVQRLVEAGILTEEEARNHPRQNVLARVLGSDQPPLVEVLAPPWRLQSGDRILICSDGLHGELEDETIAEVLQHHPAQEAADLLVKLANQAGGNDNITVHVLAYGPPQPVAEPETWYTFTNPTTGFLFHGGFLLLFFVWGYLAGQYDNRFGAPRLAFQTQPRSNPVIRRPTIAANLPNKAGAPCDTPAAQQKEKCRIPQAGGDRAIPQLRRTTQSPVQRRVQQRSTVQQRSMIQQRSMVQQRSTVQQRTPAVRQPDTRPDARPPLRRPDVRPPVVRRPDVRPPARAVSKPVVKRPAVRPTSRPIAPPLKAPTPRVAPRKAPATRRPAAPVKTRPTSRPAARKVAPKKTQPTVRKAAPKKAQPTSRPAPKK